MSDDKSATVETREQYLARMFAPLPPDKPDAEELRLRAIRRALDGRTGGNA